MDFAGTVEAVCDGVKDYSIGDEKQMALIEQLGATAINYKTETVEQYVSRHTNGKDMDVVSLLFYFVVIYSIFRGRWSSNASFIFFSTGSAWTLPTARLTDERSIFIRRATSAPEILSSRTAK
jgi:hypothetical protein